MIMKCVFVGGKYNGLEVDLTTVEKLDVIGRTPDYSKERENGCCVPRKELDNMPIIDGYLSPMWDYGKLRYETWEVYELLSH